MDESLRKTSPTKNFLLSSTLQGKTTHAQKTIVRGGTVLARPFKTSDKPFHTTPQHDSSIAFGLHNKILNRPECSSTVRSTHNLTAVKAVSAGTMDKRSVPYHPEAARNRLKNDPKRGPKPFDITYHPDNGIPNQSRTSERFTTMQQAATKGSEIPMEARVGFTNGGCTSEWTRRRNKTVLAVGKYSKYSG